MHNLLSRARLGLNKNKILLKLILHEVSAEILSFPKIWQLNVASTILRATR